ncbi:hypothetical protein Clacol_000003 [Clathrus columnatus]|uniref:Uncharacterized protein n=1 Tax=Clathrus columnatus TaxID=1419009 RepID=A0AAV4ZYM9_9AGAM|nr:hypothetical protein Clacol_000003 [Clathrus columnatus]
MEDSLTVYDPIAGQTSFYQPRTSDHDSATTDTILYGETTAVHGATFGDFLFYGRTRSSDGKIFLVRRPANPGMDDLGVWVFSGYIYGGCHFVGDWWNTSTTKDAPGGSGWFRLTKAIK